MKTSLPIAMLLALSLTACGGGDDDNSSSTTVSATSISLSTNKLSLVVGNTGTLTATVLPSNTTDTVVWASTSTDIATVSGGVVTAVSTGNTSIKATAGTKTAYCTVTVTASSTGGGSTSGTNYSQTSGNIIVPSSTYVSSTSDQNAVKVSGGTFTMNDCTVKKTGGDTSDSDGSSFYGTNAGILASGTGKVIMTGGTITTNAKGANAIVAYGGTVEVSDVTMNCTANLSRGIHATGGGTIKATNLTITTAGSNSSVIATDRGGGTVTVTGGTYKTTGTDCAVMYSTGTITATGITGSSSQGEIGVIEGSNTININNSTITSGSSSRAMMILQSGSGDASGYNGYINIVGGTMIVTGSSTPLIEITTSTKGTLTLKDVSLTLPSGVLMKVDYNTRWKTTSHIAYLVLDTASSATYSGDVTVDSYGTATVTVNTGVTWTGKYDTANTGKSTTVVVNGTWTLNGDSNVDTVTIAKGGVINCNGHTLSYTTITNNGTLNK